MRCAFVLVCLSIAGCLSGPTPVDGVDAGPSEIMVRAQDHVLLVSNPLPNAVITGDVTSIVVSDSAQFEAGHDFTEVFVLHPSVDNTIRLGAIPIGAETQIPVRSFIFGFFADTMPSDNSGSVHISSGQAEIDVRGLQDSILLDQNSPALGISLTAGSYVVRASGDATYNPGKFYQELLLLVVSPEGPRGYALPIGSTAITIKTVDSGGNNVYAFFVDVEPTNNTGSAAIDFTPQP